MFVMLLLLYPLVILLSGVGLSYGPVMVVWFGVVLVTFVGSIVGLVLAGTARVKGGWAVAGLVNSIISLLLSLAAGVLGLIGL